MSALERPRRAEVLAGLSVALDLGLGQPAEHMLRSTVLASQLATRLGLTDEQRATTYYTTLIMWIGCNADSQEYARWFGDDVAMRAESYLVDWSGLPYLRYIAAHIAKGETLGTKVKTWAALARGSKSHFFELIHSHCSSAAHLAVHLGIGNRVETVLPFTFERHDGGGLPVGVSGEAIAVEMRIAQFSDVIEVHHRLYGPEGAIAVAHSRRGGQFHPAVVDAFLVDPHALLATIEGEDSWSTALALAPDRDDVLTAAELDDLVGAIGDFVDLKCPFTLGHSRNVAALAGAAGEHLGLAEDEVATLRRAGHLHDIGRLGVSNQIWGKPSDLSPSERERVRMHPYLTDRVLIRIPGLDRERLIARSHHEHLDGTGYPLGLAGAALGRSERLLAAAVDYQSAIEPRPYRAALTPAQAASRLRDRSRQGALDADCVDAVLAAAGHVASRSRRADALTPRESEILGLVARGLSNREIASHLVLSEKTVRNHVERTYAKIGATNRVGASLHALEHGLVAPPPRA